MDPVDGWHHVMNRGVARQRIFFSRGDGRAFESLLADGYETFGVEIHAFCLMPNHFHLLVHCPDGGLSPYMQRLSSGYTRHVNNRLDRDGPIFRGRFRSLLIDSDRYLACAGRYIHRNPLDLRPPVGLADYEWSSFRHYCGVVDPPPWLTLSLSATHGGPWAYRQFVEHEVDAVMSGSLEWAIATAIAECDDASLTDRAKIHRTVALVMLDLADPPVISELEDLLSYATPRARREAVRRARRRLADNAMLERIARRALDLAA